MNEQIVEGGDAILDQVVLRVNAKHKAQVHDPRRTLAGTLTPMLTWGLFGLVAGGFKSSALWAAVGAICGGIYGYYFEHLLSKDQLKRIGSRLPGDSSAIVAFVRGADPERILSAATASQPATASVAAVMPDLSVQVHGDSQPVEPDEKGSALNMLLVRFAGEHKAKESLAKFAAKSKDERTPQVELFIETSEQGRRRVVAPITGTADFARFDVLGWGVFGVAWGLIVGFSAGDQGILSFVESGLWIGILWGIFGAFAGALYGMWAGRGLSARRLKGLGAFVPPDSSMAVAWVEESLSQAAIERWAPCGSQRLGLSFDPVGDGAVLGVVR